MNMIDSQPIRSSGGLNGGTYRNKMFFLETVRLVLILLDFTSDFSHFSPVDTNRHKEKKVLILSAYFANKEKRFSKQTLFSTAAKFVFTLLYKLYLISEGANKLKSVYFNRFLITSDKFYLVMPCF